MRVANLNELMELLTNAYDVEVAEVAKIFCNEVDKLIRPYSFLKLSDIAEIISRKEDFKRTGKNLAACFKRVDNPFISVGDVKAFLTGIGNCSSAYSMTVIADNVLMDVWAPECASMRESGLYPEEAIDVVDDLLVLVSNNLARWAYEAADTGASLIETILRKENAEEIAVILESAERVLEVMYRYGISKKRMSLFQDMSM